MPRKTLLTSRAAALFAVTVLSCYTLPKPQSEADTLLVIRVKGQKTGTDEAFPFDAILTIDKTREVTISANMRLTSASGLAPGPHAVTKIGWVRPYTTKIEKEWDLNYRFEVESGKMSILPIAIALVLEKEGNTLYQKFDLPRLTPSEVAELEDILKKYRNYELWMR